MKNILLIALCLVLSYEASSQWSVGARFGRPAGITIKKYSRDNKSAFEVIAGYNVNFDDDSEGFMLTPVFERLGTFTKKGDLSVIVGAGLPMIFAEEEFKMGAGVMVGLDWRIMPRFGLQFDWLPSYIFVNDSYFSGYYSAISARWLFGRKD